MGTVGGNLAGGDPLTDPGASLIALDAEVTLASSKGQRTLPLDEFFIDYYQTAMEPGELLTEIHVPPPSSTGLVAYQIHAAQRRRFRHGRRGDHAPS